MIDGFILQEEGLYKIQKQIVLEAEYTRPWSCQDEETKIRELTDDM